MKFIYNDLITGKTISASSEESGYSINNITDIRLSKKWRATDDTAEWIKIDMGAAVNVDAVAIVAHNLTAGATIKIQANATDLWTGPTIDQTITYKPGIMWYFWSAVQSYQWWRLTIVDTANPDTYVELGRLILCEHYELDEFPNADLKEDIIDNSLNQFSLTEQIYTDIRIKRRVYSIGMGILQEATRQSLLSLFDLVRTYNPFVVLLEESNTDKLEPIYCILNKALGFRHAGGWLWRDKRFYFREVF